MKYDFKNNKYFRWGSDRISDHCVSVSYIICYSMKQYQTGFHTITEFLCPCYGLV